MTILSERIHHTWKEKEMYLAVFMDVASAFNNVHHVRLIDNMKKRRIPGFIIAWTESFLRDRSTSLRFNAIISEEIWTDARVPQGSPLSQILYMYYNAELLNVPRTCGERTVQSLGFIDDIAYGVQGQTNGENAHKLQQMLEMRAVKTDMERSSR